MDLRGHENIQGGGGLKRGRRLIRGGCLVGGALLGRRRRQILVFCFVHLDTNFNKGDMIALIAM